ncbi:MAG TPA: sugar kinase [Chloroflexia bacterium]|nr:sugar kinase [Chloroflexia bacterium]
MQEPGLQPVYDVVTLGETMLRLTPPNLKRLEQTQSLDIEVGGSESNTAVGLARLGLKVAWLSRMTDNPLGRLIARTIAGHGVDTSYVTWTDQDRIGLYFLEEGRAPRGSSIIYDRANSAASRIQPTDLPSELFTAGKARLLHLTGITPALGPQAAATTRHAIKLAKEAGWLFSFDLNYRSRLWATLAAREGCEPLAAAADLLIAPLGDTRLLYNLSPECTPVEALAELSRRFPRATVVLTLGKQGAIGCEPQGKIVRQSVFRAEEVGRIGGGDAFAAGLLYGYLLNQPDRLATALRWGAAVAALKYSIPGDLPVIDKAEAIALVEQGDRIRARLTR